MCGVGTVPSKRLFQIFTALVGLVTLQWRRLCVGLMGGFIGIFIFIVHLRIGRKILLIGLWTLFTLRKCGELALIRFVGSQQGVEVLMLEVSFFLPSYSFFPLEVGVAIKGPSRGGFLFMDSFFR